MAPPALKIQFVLDLVTFQPTVLHQCLTKNTKKFKTSKIVFVVQEESLLFILNIESVNK